MVPGGASSRSREIVSFDIDPVLLHLICRSNRLYAPLRAQMIGEATVSAVRSADGTSIAFERLRAQGAAAEPARARLRRAYIRPARPGGEQGPPAVRGRARSRRPRG